MRFFRNTSDIGFGLMLSMAFCATPFSAAAVTVHGRISDAISGEPIAGALIKVYAWYNDAEPAAFVQTTTDGAYAWTGDLAPERMARLNAVAFGHSSDEYFFISSSSDVQKDFALFPASIAGIVRDAAGAPTARVAVQVWVRAENSPEWVVRTRSVTAADGTYQFMALPPGEYRICAGGMLSGLVQECYRGVPVSHFSDIDAATPITLGDGETRHDIDFDLTAGASLAGSLTDERSGNAIASADVAFELYDVAGKLIDTGKGRTDVSGAYQLHGVPSGSFYMTARIRSNGFSGKQLYSGINCPANDCAPINAGDAISVADGGSTGNIDFSFGPEAIIRGRVTDILDGAPVPNVRVSACYNDSFVFITHCDFSAMSGADGRYELDVNARNYFVLAIAPFAHIDQVYPDTPCVGSSCTSNVQDMLVESGAELEDIDFALRRSATLAGRVLDSRTGSPLAQVRVIGYGTDSKEIWSGYTDNNGRYFGRKWFAGTYYVLAYGNEQCTVYLDRPCPPYMEPISSIDPTPVTLAAEEHREGIDLMLTEPPIFMNGFESETLER